MSIEHRQYIRFSLDIPAIRISKYNDPVNILLPQISIGGCLTEWDESILVGDEFRLLIQLPNKNFLPLHCKALYRFVNNGIGVRFINITQFEQELISQIISHNLEEQGLPMQIDFFGLTAKNKTKNHNQFQLSETRKINDEILEDIMG